MIKNLSPMMRDLTPRIANRPVMIFGDHWLWTCPRCPRKSWQTSCDTYVRALLAARRHLFERHPGT